MMRSKEYSCEAKSPLWNVSLLPNSRDGARECPYAGSRLFTTEALVDEALADARFCQVWSRLQKNFRSLLACLFRDWNNSNQIQSGSSAKPSFVVRGPSVITSHVAVGGATDCERRS